MSTRLGGSPAAMSASPGRPPLPLLAVFAGGIATPLLTWTALVQVAGVDLVVDTGTGARPVGPVAVLVAAAVATLGAVGLARLLRRGSNVRRRFLIWTLLATALSLVGPTGAAESTAAVLGLVALHLSVAVPVIATVAARLPQ